MIRALVLVVLALPASAQVYRCGEGTYQATPCPAGAASAVIQAPKPRPPAKGPSSGREACRKALPAYLKDPDSARVSDDVLDLGPAETAEGKPAWKWSLWVNARNSFGGYTCFQELVCLTTRGGERVLGVSGR